MAIHPTRSLMGLEVLDFAPRLLLAWDIMVVIFSNVLKDSRLNLDRSDYSILVAMRSHVLPCPLDKSGVDTPLDSSSPLNFSPSFSDCDPAMRCESWGEESTIELCEVRLNCDGALLSEYELMDLVQNSNDLIRSLFETDLSSHPLPAIHLSKAPLVNMSIIHTPPVSQSLQTDDQTSPLNPGNTSGKGHIFLCSSFLDFEDCES